jgi:hypothetical protein
MRPGKTEKMENLGTAGAVGRTSFEKKLPAAELKLRLRLPGGSLDLQAALIEPAGAAGGHASRGPENTM